jgi:hypothetical protein
VKGTHSGLVQPLESAKSRCLNGFLGDRTAIRLLTDGRMPIGSVETELDRRVGVSILEVVRTNRAPACLRDDERLRDLPVITESGVWIQTFPGPSAPFDHRMDSSDRKSGYVVEGAQRAQKNPSYPEA